MNVGYTKRKASDWQILMPFGAFLIFAVADGQK